MNSLFKPKKGEASSIDSLADVQARVHLKIQLLNDEISEVRAVINHLNIQDTIFKEHITRLQAVYETVIERYPQETHTSNNNNEILRAI